MLAARGTSEPGPERERCQPRGGESIKYWRDCRVDFHGTPGDSRRRSYGTRQSGRVRQFASAARLRQPLLQRPLAFHALVSAFAQCARASRDRIHWD